MSEDCILDGQAHKVPYTEAYAYIGRYISASTNIEDLESIRKQLTSDYINYLFLNDREGAVEMLSRYLINFGDLEFIYKPASQVSMLAQKAVSLVRFKRSEKDNL